ncbi:MAG: hypothetical protein K2I70_02465, partial [Bacilli bacterium]|nr:hypothetical protein [Bacilli bacterium]
MKVIFNTSFEEQIDINKIDKIFIILGNPLLKEEADSVSIFKKAIQGRYYNIQMGVDVEDGMDIV